MSGEITVGSQQFMVILGQMEDAIGTLAHHRSLLETTRDHIKKQFGNATQSWDSPAADGFRIMLPTVEGNMDDLLSALDTIQDRLTTTHQNYLAAEQANKSSLAPPTTGPKIDIAAGPGHVNKPHGHHAEKPREADHAKPRVAEEPRQAAAPAQPMMTRREFHGQQPV